MTGLNVNEQGTSPIRTAVPRELKPDGAPKPSRHHIRLLRPKGAGYAPLGLTFEDTTSGEERLMFFSKPGAGRVGVFQIEGGPPLPKRVELLHGSGVVGRGSYVANLKCLILTVEAWPHAGADGRIWLKWRPL